MTNRESCLPASELHQLGRLGRSLGEPSSRRVRRRARVRRQRFDGAARLAVQEVTPRRRLARRPVLVSAALLLVAFTWVGSAAHTQTGPADALADLPAAPAAASAPASAKGVLAPRRASAARASRATTQQRPFAAVDDLVLTLPFAEPIAVAFHEATRAEALPLAPIGRLVANDNPTKFTPGADAPGPDYRVLSSRGRARPASSAADIVVPDDAIVTAPVSGRVVEVREYALYEHVRDWRVVIEPAGHPDLHVVLIHLLRPQVAAGDAVHAGVTPLALVRRLPFASHVDYVTEQSLPHVHLEVKPAVDPEPADPNAPALPAPETVDA